MQLVKVFISPSKVSELQNCRTTISNYTFVLMITISRDLPLVRSHESFLYHVINCYVPCGKPYYSISKNAKPIYLTKIDIKYVAYAIPVFAS